MVLCLTPRLGRFTPGKETRYLLYGRLGVPQGRPERERKISLPSGFESQTAQPVATRYTDCLEIKNGKYNYIILFSL
jgi:hypothetical protein